MVDVMSYHGSAALMDAEIKIYDAIDNSRLRMIGYQAINELTDEQKQQLLLTLQDSRARMSTLLLLVIQRLHLMTILLLMKLLQLT